MSGLFYRVDPVVSVDEVKEFGNADQLDERVAQKEGMVERAKNLSLNQRGKFGEGGRISNQTGRGTNAGFEKPMVFLYYKSGGIFKRANYKILERQWFGEGQSTAFGEHAKHFSNGTNKCSGRAGQYQRRQRIGGVLAEQAVLSSKRRSAWVLVLDSHLLRPCMRSR